MAARKNTPKSRKAAGKNLRNSVNGKAKPDSVPVAPTEVPAYLMYVFAYTPPGGITDVDLVTGAMCMRDVAGRMLMRTQNLPRLGPRRPRSVH